MVPCSELPPLVTTTRAGDASVNVRDAPAPLATAFSEVAPAPAGPDAQTLYYYYDSEVEDSEEVALISSSLVEALVGAGFNSGLQGPVNTTAERLLAVANGTAPLTTLRAQAGPSAAGASTGAASDVVATVPLPFGVSVVARRRPRTNSTVPSSSGSSSPAWLRTAAPGTAAGVYTRDADKTGRIMSALMMTGAAAGRTAEAGAAAGAAAPGVASIIQEAGGW